jgi:hypothetical protein
MWPTEGKIRFQTVNQPPRVSLASAGRRLAAILLYLFWLAHPDESLAGLSC